MIKTEVIAEIGVNHNGSLELAKEHCLAAKEVGCKTVKFQSYRTEQLITPLTEMAEYQKASVAKSQSQFDLLKSLELSFDELMILKNFCESLELEFLATPHDDISLKFLTDLGIHRLKIASGDIGNTPFLRKVGVSGLEVILSTGMSSLDEVDYSVNTLLEAGLDKSKLTLLHCTSSYPAPPSDCNLRAMLNLRDTFGVRCGYSDHTVGAEAAKAAVAMGAVLIEKHFTLDKSLPGPDHQASSEPSEFNETS